MAFPDSNWWRRLQSALNADEAWRDAALYFRGRIELRHDHGAGTIAVSRGGDLDAVRNAVTEPWSSGRTEGQISRLKTMKRAMYGRAGVGLLRARMLPL